MSIESVSAAVIITINAVPTGIALSQDSVVENSANGTVVSTLTGTDPDIGDSFTFSLLDDAGGRFAISGADLIVAGAIDYEAAHVYPVRCGPALVGSADHLMDFERGDVLRFSPADFGLPAGRLAAANLVFGAPETEVDAEFVYDS